VIGTDGTVQTRPVKVAQISDGQALIHRPIATALLMVGLLLCGLVTYRLLLVSSLPNVNFPTILSIILPIMDVLLRLW
jgi:hypothetical protein